jgi:hypothetical protein
VEGNPLNRMDPLGLEWVARICCNGKGGFKVCWNRDAPSFDRMVMQCMEKHEDQHLADLPNEPVCRNLCQDKKKDFVVMVPSDVSDKLECSAYKTELDCLKRNGPLPSVRNRIPGVEKSIKKHCKPTP